MQLFTILDVKLNLDYVFMTVIKEAKEQNKTLYKFQVYKLDGFTRLGNGYRSMMN